MEFCGWRHFHCIVHTLRITDAFLIFWHIKLEQLNLHIVGKICARWSFSYIHMNKIRNCPPSHLWMKNIMIRRVMNQSNYLPWSLYKFTCDKFLQKEVLYANDSFFIYLIGAIVGIPAAFRCSSRLYIFHNILFKRQILSLSLRKEV